MGREIVRQESLEDPGKRSRLWHLDDVLEVLRYGTGTEAVKGLLLNTIDVQVNAKPFEKMDKLWYHESVLEVRRDTMGTEEVENCLLNSNDPEHVQAFGCLKELWMVNCSLSYLPDEIGRLISLETFIIRGNCLSTLPDGIGNLSCLKTLYVFENKLSHLPSGIGNLMSLDSLVLECESLLALPDSFCSLTRLEFFQVNRCNLSHLPSEIGNLVSLKELVLLDGGNNIYTLPDSICSLTQLESLQIDGCNLSHLPSKIGNLVSLKFLGLRGNNFCTLPDSIRNVRGLGNIILDNCAKLQSLPKLPACRVSAVGCTSLESIPFELDQLGLSIQCRGCNKLAENNFANSLLKQLHKSKGLAELKEVVDILVPTGGEVICNKIEKDDRRFETRKVSTCQDQVWLVYTPQGYSGLHLEGGDEVEISIRSTRVAMANVNWGVDFIYEAWGGSRWFSFLFKQQLEHDVVQPRGFWKAQASDDGCGGGGYRTLEFVLQGYESPVVKQKGSLAGAFAKHEERLKESPDGLVKKWREALTEVANLSGWDLPKVANGDEAHLIRKVVEEVQNKSHPIQLNVACHEIGLESRIQKLKVLFKMESADVRIVAVWGMGGIGKTTIVKKLYNLIQHKFEGSCFLTNIREISKQPKGLVDLQAQLLSDILGTGTHNLRNFHHGIEVIKRRAFCRKVLLILDDVDDVQQLIALAIDRDFFGFGSRIIITTRDISTLNLVKVDEIYAAEELNKEESLELFREIVRQESFEDPGKRSRLWYLEDVLEVLRYGTGTEFVKGLCLNTTHVQVNAKPFEKMDKLWNHENVLEVRRDSMGIEAAEGRFVNLTDPQDVQAFSCLKELKLSNCCLSYLPDEIGNIISLHTLNLRLNNMSTLPERICNLTCLKCLDLGGNNLSHLPSEIGRLIALETWFSEGNSLCTLPDSIGNLSCLKFLDVDGNKLSHLPCEIGGLTSLENLNLGNCNLSHLPSEFGRLVSLKTLELRGNNFLTLPESICDLFCLKEFKLDGCNLSHLPSEIENLISLKYLGLGCKSLLTLPDSICSLTRLENLLLDGCNLSHLPSEIGLAMICTGINKLAENNFANCLLKQLHKSKGLSELQKVVDILVPTSSGVPIWFPY
ncbi:hypothetical protein Vadar_018692 [Vaccinium darrowii]|uniref:Uncharacterized protein n=1 Tax=Vaccinium darrowii TaxID=229202 RepID=A0ACB7YP04_9ERIC|nr:hypothetical protein Vadar_018692 [Vaccinium darrowii]